MILLLLLIKISFSDGALDLNSLNFPQIWIIGVLISLATPTCTLFYNQSRESFSTKILRNSNPDQTDQSQSRKLDNETWTLLRKHGLQELISRFLDCFPAESCTPPEVVSCREVGNEMLPVTSNYRPDRLLIPSASPLMIYSFVKSPPACWLSPLVLVRD